MAQQDVRAARRWPSAALSMPVLARTWQMLLKGLEDVRLAPSPLLAAEMVLVRLAYAAELPPPAELFRRPADGGRGRRASDRAPARPRDVPAPTMRATAQEPPVSPGSFAEAVALFERFGEPMLHGWLYQAAQLVHFEPGRIELRLAPGRRPDLPGRVAAALGRWTGRPWLVSAPAAISAAAPTLAEQAAAERRPASTRSPRTRGSSRSCSSFPGRPSSTCARPPRAEHRSPITEQP